MHDYQVGNKVFFPVHTTDSEVEWCEGKIQNYRQDIKKFDVGGTRHWGWFRREELKPYNLQPCPFCGSNQTNINTSKNWTGMRHVIISVSIIHHCDGDPLASRLEIKAKTLIDAIHKWNTRTPLLKNEIV